ncbi:hypothetical protein KIH74_20670 [Kineosporia sp. J2-2]|uniref:Uncharacterized protein n=1 Tax=Kineosporia corallincola TaxID=2835133 RepID=A0ABS5TJS4_9ACTN|nr:hypothetical protein [Kineosporia corallincola]MBT0771364.1 hypothetical protein [Kineosporia corallincola]
MTSKTARCWVLRSTSATPADQMPTEYGPTHRHHTGQDTACAALRGLIDEDPVYFSTFEVIALDHVCVFVTCDECGTAIGREDEGVTFHYPDPGEAKQWATGWGWKTNGHRWVCGYCQEEHPMPESGPVSRKENHR